VNPPFRDTYESILQRGLQMLKRFVALVLLPAAAWAAPIPATRGEKMVAILRAEDGRTQIGLVAELLHDPDPGVRRRAALAAGRIGDASLALGIADRLTDPVPEVREMAAFALGLAGDARMAARLVPVLKDRDPHVRARAVEAMGRIGDGQTAPIVAHMVLDALPKNVAPVVVRGDDPSNPRDPWLESRLGLFALVTLKDIPSAAAVLLEGGRSRFDWWAATWAAAALGAPELDPVLLEASRSTDPLSRAFSAVGLARSKAAGATDALLKLAQDGDEGVAERALRALGRTDDARTWGVLQEALRTNSPRRILSALRRWFSCPRRRHRARWWLDSLDMTNRTSEGRPSRCWRAAILRTWPWSCPAPGEIPRGRCGRRLRRGWRARTTK
jgi:HEAT repeat protein